MSGTTSFALPIDVPWYLIAASPDMMATTFCESQTSSDDTQAYPPAWHSSLAIYAYEPSPDDLPAEMCNQKVTYLKVTCSITGYQPTAAETTALAGSAYNFASSYSESTPNESPYELSFPNVPGGVPIDNTQVFGDFLDAYFACYGVLLNVKVLPSVSTLPQATPTDTKTFGFNGPAVLSNPYQASPDGLTFTVFRAGVARNSLSVVALSGGSYGVRLNPGTTLEIDLPLSTNVGLQVFAPGQRGTNGVIESYEFGSHTSDTPLVANQPGALTDFELGNVPITRLVIKSVDDDTAFVAVTYSSLERSITLSDYPHIIDFEPKTRDLYQAATDQNEVLTGSNSNVSTGKSLTNTSSSQMGLSLSGGYSASGASVNAGLTSSWGNTSSNSSMTNIDQSRQLRETQGSSTNLVQQYNLLTGYHAGTNRVAFVMLPRPHTLQATDYRTFVRGLRIIEGVQEFFLIVSRPRNVPGLCIEASLETGHFPENITLAAPPAPQFRAAPPPTTTFQLPIPAFVPGGNINAQYSNNTQGGFPQPSSQTFSLPNPWILDLTRPAVPVGGYPQTGSYPGVSWVMRQIDPTQNGWFAQAQHTAQVAVQPSLDGTSVTINIIINSGGNAFQNDAAMALFDFTIYATQPAAVALPGDPEQDVVVSDFLVTSRDLCVCINSCAIDNCVVVGPTEQVPYSQSAGQIAGSTDGSAPPPGSPGASSPPGPQRMAAVGARISAASAAGRQNSPRGPKPVGKHGVHRRTSIVYEAKLTLPLGLIHASRLQQSRTPAARELMHKIQHHMVNNWRMPQRRPHGAVGFLESDYFCERVRNRLPKEHLSQRAVDLTGISPEDAKRLGNRATVGDLLKLDFLGLQKHTKLRAVQTAALRRRLLGLVSPQPAKPPADSPAGSAPSSASSAHAEPPSTSRTSKPRPRRGRRA